MYGAAGNPWTALVIGSAVALSIAMPAAAETKAGVALAITQSTTAIGPAGDRNLAATEPVYMGDSIVTNLNGHAEIRLLDDTRLVVGPNSSMVIDDFVFSGNGQAGAVAINAVRGAFRFMTGASPKDAYSIKTPMATIGVRGTRFDFSVSRLRLDFALYEGEATICNRLRACFVVKGPCAMVEARRFLPVQPVTSAEDRARLMGGDTFPYLADQRRLRRDFRVDTSSCQAARTDILPGAASIQGKSRGFGLGSSFGSAVVGPAAVGGASASSSHNNNGFGNGGEGAEGATEAGNPGGGGGGGGGGNGSGGGKP